MPLAAVIDDANRNDHKLMRQTIEALPVERPQLTQGRPHHLGLHKGYDYTEPRALAEEFGLPYTCGPEARKCRPSAKRHARAKARRRVVERAHS